MTETAYFAAGCFWGVEAGFRALDGVEEAISGYMGGHVAEPDYKSACRGETGHAETVKVVYNPALVSYDKLLTFFFDLHDPTQVNRQGPDIGSQYRSAIFVMNEDQASSAHAAIALLDASDRFSAPVATEVAAAQESGPAKFWPAEEYHQRYFEKHGRVCHF